MLQLRIMRKFGLLLAAMTVLSACGGATTPTTGGATSAAAGDTSATAAPAAGVATSAAAGDTSATAAPAAGVATSAPAASGEQVTLTWGFWGSPEEQASHKKIAEGLLKVFFRKFLSVIKSSK